MTSTGLPTTPEGVLRRLEWRVLRRLDGRMQGNYRTLLRGSGIDVADLREYEPGDDVRHMDWNVTARTDTPHVRTFMEDREVTAWLLLDRSASMSFGPVDRPKQQVLTDFSTCMARLLIRSGNNVGAMLYNGGPTNHGIERVLPPRATRTHVLHLAQLLMQPSIPPALRAETPANVTPTRRWRKRVEPEKVARATRLADLLEHAQQTIKRRSYIVVVSDFISEPGWERPMLMLSQRHDVVAVRLVDPRENDLPDLGLMVFEDAESGELISVDTADPEFRERFRTEAAKAEETLRAAAKHARVDLHRVATDDDLVDALVRIVDQRKKQRLR